jgi:ribosomal protein S18 acetylase RimI-like enzyme
MRFLLDTNIFIPAEPTSAADVEAGTPSVVALLNALALGGHIATLHPASARELQNDRNPDRAATRALLLGKYPELPRPPEMSTRLLAALGAPAAGSNSEIDLLLLSAVDADAVDYFVTEDERLHRRAKRVGLADRVLTAADAIITVRSLFPSLPQPPPLVAAKLAHELDDADPIFASFRLDYPPFDAWLAKCKRQHRQTWVIQVGRRYCGVCIVNDESPNDYGFPGKVLKICSFKIADSYRGYRYGELLLKTIFGYLVENRYDGVFVEVYSKHEAMFNMLAEFGFEDVRSSAKGERVLLKMLRPPAYETQRLAALEFNIKYGPHALSFTGASIFAVPILPKYHRLLFPELEQQLSLSTESHPFGNSIRKAYLCHSHIRKVAAGDAVLFYRSEIDRGITAIGVVEKTLVSADAVTIARFVGKRTVYSFAQIEEMASKPVLAVLFRLARILQPFWGVDLLKRAGIIKRAPQSFMQVRQEAVDWIATQLDVQR